MECSIHMTGGCSSRPDCSELVARKQGREAVLSVHTQIEGLDERCGRSIMMIQTPIRAGTFASSRRLESSPIALRIEAVDVYCASGGVHIAHSMVLYAAVCSGLARINNRITYSWAT
jgi:hypothetical protein